MSKIRREMVPAIRVRDVTAIAKGDLILKPTNLDIPRGGLTLISGENGSGKSTLVNTFNAVRRPDTGSVQHLDTLGNVIFENSAKTSRNLIQWSADKLWRDKRRDEEISEYRTRRIGLVAQKADSLPNLTAGQSLEWLQTAVGNVNDPNRRDSLVEQFGLGDHMDKYPSELSGGLRQRFEIISSVIHDPDIILADEPMNHLDSKIGPLVINLLRAEADAGKTVVFISHKESDHRQYADTVIHMVDGVATLE